MTERRQWVRVLWREQPGLHRGYLVDVATAIVMAVALFLGGRERTVAPVWRTLNDNGGPEVWGLVFAAVATLLIAATFVTGQVMMYALWFAAMPYGLVGLWFLLSATSEPTASFVGAIYSFRAAIMHISRATSYYAGPASDSS